MKNKLEEFVNRNREDFDSELPPADTWKGVERTGMDTPITHRKIFKLFTWAQVAASILVLASAVTIFLLLDKSTPDPVPANATAPAEQTVGKQPAYQEEIDEINKVVEAKQARLEEIKKSDPVLYKKFSTSLDQLNDSYRDLEKQLNNNPNNEQLLEAMIQNLSLQQELLNQQLSIYQKIKQNKNEKANKNI